MACGCGGTNGGSGGCGGDKPLANPLLETELTHELPQATASAVVEFDPAPAAPGADAEPLLIASSEQDWPRIRVNGVLIEPEAMALELQYHPAAEQSEAMFLAAQALVIRELLQQRCSALSVQVEAGIGESQEEAAIRSLIELEVPVQFALSLPSQAPVWVRTERVLLTPSALMPTLLPPLTLVSKWCITQ